MKLTNMNDDQILKYLENKLNTMKDSLEVAKHNNKNNNSTITICNVNWLSDDNNI